MASLTEPSRVSLRFRYGSARRAQQSAGLRLAWLWLNQRTSLEAIT
jgi:hypothetical protein